MQTERSWWRACSTHTNTRRRSTTRMLARNSSRILSWFILLAGHDAPSSAIAFLPRFRHVAFPFAQPFHLSQNPSQLAGTLGKSVKNSSCFTPVIKTPERLPVRTNRWKGGYLTRESDESPCTNRDAEKSRVISTFSPWDYQFLTIN